MMDRAGLAIVWVSIYLLVYHVSTYVGLPEDFTLLLFAISPFCVLYLVYMVLKFGKPSPHTFDQRFYDDWEYERNGKEEIELNP